MIPYQFDFDIIGDIYESFINREGKMFNSQFDQLMSNRLPVQTLPIQTGSTDSDQLQEIQLKLRD